MARYKIPTLVFLMALMKLAVAQDKKKEKEGEEVGVTEAITSEYIITDDYVHSWISFPKVPKTKKVVTGAEYSYTPKKGKAAVVIFVASWCQPCQLMIPKLVEIEKKYSKLHTDFIYVFTHDRQKDARDFVLHVRKQFKDKDSPNFRPLDTSILATQKLLNNFHTPSPPGIYVGDRHAYLNRRFLRVRPEKLPELDDYLRRMNSHM